MKKIIFLLCLMANLSAWAQPKKPIAPRPRHTQQHQNPTVHQQPRTPSPAQTVDEPRAVVSYEGLVRLAGGYVKTQNAANEKSHGLSRFTAGGFRDEDKRLITVHDSTNAECKISYTEIGFFFPEKNEWSWIWWNNQSMDAVKEYGKQKKMEKLTTETMTIAGMDEANNLANVAAYVLKARGVKVVPAPDGSHYWFVTINSVSCTK
jgi:hypothetical protein